MQGDLELTLIATVVLAALACGLTLERFRQPAILGYIMAGIILGPSLLGFVENRAIVADLAELGVLMLLFLTGMELSLKSFKDVLFTSIGAMLCQLVATLLVVGCLGYFLNLGVGLILVLSCSIALSSTAVAVKMVSVIEESKTLTGQVTLGVLIAQDLAIVPIILFLKGIAAGGMIVEMLVKIILAVSILIVFIWYLSRRETISLPFSKMVSGHNDLMPLAALLFCFGCASLSGLIGLSAAYGAFLGGLIIGNTLERSLMVEATRPIQSVLMMVFFLSVGLLMEIPYILGHLPKIIILTLFITVGKTFMNIFILRSFSQPWQRAFLTSLLLSQMGEFTFLLATIGLEARLISESGKSLIITLAAISLAFSPLWLSSARRLHNLATSKSTFQQLLAMVSFHEVFSSLWIKMKFSRQKPAKEIPSEHLLSHHAQPGSKDKTR